MDRGYDPRYDRGYHHHGRGGRRGGPITAGIKLLASGVGLASESIKTHKEHKATKAAEAAAAAAEEEGERSHAVTRFSEHGGESSKQAAMHSEKFEDTQDPPPAYTPSATTSAAPEKSRSASGLPSHYADASDSKLPAQFEDLSVESSSHKNHDPEKASAAEMFEADLEEEWALDDAQHELIHEDSLEKDSLEKDSLEKHPSGEEAADSVADLEQAFLRDHPPPAYTVDKPIEKLPLPVIIPQRRPKERARGFIRAYAPVMEQCGIDQATWMSFLDNFHKSSTASPWLNCINLASFATIAIPSPIIGQVVGYAIMQITKASIELQGRQRTNDFLQTMNKEFFQPRGLYCLIMTYNPNSNQRVEQININTTIAKNTAPKSTMSSMANKFKTSDATTVAPCQFPETAPLIFPALDELSSQTGGGDDGAAAKGGEDGMKKKKESALKKKHAFVADYLDRRATAAYTGQNPNTPMSNVPQREFKSRYADPNNPAASGSLISFVSGGKLVPAPESRGLIGGVASVIDQKVRGVPQGSGSQGQYYYGGYNDPYGYGGYGYGRGRYGGRGVGGGPLGALSPITMVKKVLKQNVLYMMVVNMPTEEEMAEAKATYGR